MRNIKINIYQNKKNMLEEKSSKTKLSQSNFIRKLIDDFKINSLSNSDIKLYQTCPETRKSDII